MMQEKNFILANQQNVARAGTVMTPYISTILMEIDRTKYSHLLLVMDGFSYESYCVKVPKGELTKHIMKYNGENMQRVLNSVLLEPTNNTIKNYLNNNKVESFYNIDGREM